MDLAKALRDLSEAAERAGGRQARLRAARQVVVRHCATALGVEVGDPSSIASVIRLASDAADRSGRRACAVLLLHALAVPGLVPAASDGDMCALAEGALRSALVRCGYPFGGSVEEKMHVLRRLHASIGELLQPLEPTFPNWQGLYAG
jgi:hypothetical protein